MITATQIKEFIINYYIEELTSSGINPKVIDDSFDILSNGITDSIGVLDMLCAIETQFEITFDLENLDAEQITILGPLCDYIAKNAVAKPLSA